MGVKKLIDQLNKEEALSYDNWLVLLSSYTPHDISYAQSLAQQIVRSVYGRDIYVRGLIEYTNYCKNDCYYCGIRRSNHKAERYRLTREELLSCCRQGYALGFRTFVMQGGEDDFYTDDWLEETIHEIKRKYPDCALTLSMGESSYDSYKRFYEAGADRYLLRHETAEQHHYEKLHPKELSFSHRKDCLYALKEIGYQVGCGFMVDSPFQTVETLAEDMLFIHDLKPHMIGIGPFIPHKDTPFHDRPQGSLEKTLFFISLLRIMEKHALIPATTALGTIHSKGRELGILAGANVLMPNLSPVFVRKKYALYDNKICTGEEAAECKDCLAKRIESIGYKIVCERGDYKP